MTMKKRAAPVGTAVALALVLSAASARAHHSFSAQYDSNKPIEVKGVVTKVEWTNPHARFYVDVTDPTGKATHWNFEIASPNILVRNGWQRDTLKIGDTITVTGYLARTGPPLAIAGGVTAADGRKLFSSAGLDAPQ